MYELLKKDGRAKRGRFTTVHGVIETPVFMNVGTVGAIKGAVSTDGQIFVSICKFCKFCDNIDQFFMNQLQCLPH